MKRIGLQRVLTVAVCFMLMVSMWTVIVITSGEHPPVATAESESTTTTTAVYCYATQLEYDSSPMTLGETRAIRFYHPATQTASGGDISEVSDNISVTYENGSDTVYVTALAAGSAKLYIHESDCAFGAYVYLTVEEEAVSCFPQGDADQDGKLTTSDARLVLQYCVSDVVPLREDAIRIADFDGNGVVETSDARHILRTVVTM